MLFTLATIFTLFFLLPNSAARAEAAPDTALCIQCHTARQLSSTHAEIQGGEDACLTCHAPHSRKGSPGLLIPPKDQCAVCHFEYDHKTIDNKVKDGARIHDPVLKQDCAECHLPHELGAPATYKGGDKNASCASCHTKVSLEKEAAYQHPPFESNYCTDCHDPHLAEQQALLRTAPTELCGTCHAETLAEQSMPSQHPPFAKGLCTDCHSAHASSSPHNLRVPEDQICISCHFPRSGDKPFQHQPYQEGKCTACHSPHASTAGHLVRAESQTALCTSCHTDVGSEVSGTSHHPIGQKLECTSCHKPHTADYAKLLILPGRSLCLNCHPAQGALFDGIGHGKMTVPGSEEQGSCTACHKPHGSAELSLLKAPPVSLCRQCHTPKPGSEHPTGGSTVDPATGKPVTCSSCHNPHGSLYPHAVRRPGDGLCLACHDKG